MKEKKEILGDCPLCNRPMIKGPSVDEHHFIPKCKGGKEKQYLHKTCHRFIHAQFTESELSKIYNTPEKLLDVEIIQNYMKWLQKKIPSLLTQSKQVTEKNKHSMCLFFYYSILLSTIID